ncbi:MAG: hypothetical protein K0U86_11565 [Planctomycetes bacterium]|nr:hypothetical protein [Planctomycetota bacterium]MCH9725521.1 hypothetical protein [Planctomycetota bacterium]MCH9776486.1 hypothetical protein [Planctomycetota bacterium]MCH9790140.1 hypothetical protein [Planctomycetota bacterium]
MLFKEPQPTRKNQKFFGMVSFAVSGITSLVLVVTTTMAVEVKKPQPKEVGLQGILPAEVPEDLAESPEDLEGKWAKWGDQVSDLLGKLYESELNLAQQKQTLKALQAKIKEAKGQANLAEFNSRLERRVEVADAVLKTLGQNLGTVKAVQIKSKQNELAAAVKALTKYLDTLQNGNGWVDYLQLKALQKELKNSYSEVELNDLLKSLKAQFQSRGALKDTEQRKFFNRKQFKDLEKSVNAFLAQSKPGAAKVNVSKVRQQLKALVSNLEEYEASQSSHNAFEARKAYALLRQELEGGLGSLTSALRNGYFNYNLRVMVAEDFVNRLIHDSTSETGPVVDCILGAYVTGNQETTTEVGVDFKPSETTLRFDLTLSGVTNSSTSGTTSQATIYTDGHHSFWGGKEVNFNGDLFTTQPAWVKVDANNTTVGASTKLDGVPLLSKLGRNMAYRRTEQLRGEAEAIAAQRVRDRVRPRFDEEVDGRITKSNKKVGGELNKRLRDNGLFPSARSFASTDSHLYIRTRLMDTGELAANSPPLNISAKDSVVLQLHESVMNNSLSRMGLEGRKISDQDLITEFENSLADVLGRKVKLERPPVDPDKGPNILAFDKKDPIRIEISDNTLKIILRCGFEQKGETAVPTQIITVPLSFKVAGDKIHVTRGNVKSSAVVKPKGIAAQIARAGVVRKKMEKAFPNRVENAQVKAKLENRNVFLHITGIEPKDGWLTLTVGNDLTVEKHDAVPPPVEKTASVK